MSWFPAILKWFNFVLSTQDDRIYGVADRANHTTGKFHRRKAKCIQKLMKSNLVYCLDFITVRKVIEFLF